MKKFILIYIIGLFLFAGCDAGENVYEKDVHYFFQTIRDVHPDPYQFISKSSFDSLEKAVVSDCKRMTDLRDLNVRLLACNQYWDGHTFCGISRSLSALMRSFTFPFRKSNDSLFREPAGELVAAIDTFKRERYLREVDRFLSYDLNPQSRDEKATDVCYFLLLNHFKAPRYVDVYRKDSLKIVCDAFKPIYPENTTNRKDYDFRYYPEDLSAVLEYNTCLISDADLWEKRVALFFDSLKSLNIKYLFIDIRNNGGGREQAHAPIYHHVKTENSHMNVEYKETRKGRIESLKRVIKRNDIKLNKAQAYINMFLAYLHLISEEKDIRYNYCAHPGYDGNIYILQGHHTYSAAFVMCCHMKMMTDCILVGEEVGQRNPICGNRLKFFLPNSKIPFYVAANKSLMITDLPEENGFLLPDIPFKFRSTDTLYVDEIKQIIKLRKCIN